MGTVAVKNICFVTCNGHCLTVPWRSQHTKVKLKLRTKYAQNQFNLHPQEKHLMFQNYSAESISFQTFILGRACERGFLFFLVESVLLMKRLWSLKKPPEEYFSIYSFYLLFSTFYIIFLRLPPPSTFHSQKYNQIEIRLRTGLCLFFSYPFCSLVPVPISPAQIPKEKLWRGKT